FGEARESARSPVEAAGLALVAMIAPNTPDERIKRIDDMARGFVYAVSVTGLTGSGLGAVQNVEQYLKRARGLVTKNPLLVGFGIRSHEDALRLSRHTDGFIVGSALIELIERLWDGAELPQEERLRSISQFAAELKYGKQVENAG
ncbi:MAG: tryptophan synthase subunit alpha, partial [Rhodothermales bacterium]